MGSTCYLTALVLLLAYTLNGKEDSHAGILWLVPVKELLTLSGERVGARLLCYSESKVVCIKKFCDTSLVVLARQVYIEQGFPN